LPQQIEGEFTLLFFGRWLEGFDFMDVDLLEVIFEIPKAL